MFKQNMLRLNVLKLSVLRLSMCRVLLLMLNAGQAAAASLEVEIANGESDEGYFMIRLLQGEMSFQGEQEAFAAIQRKAATGSTTITLEDLPEGEYALQIMQDTNGNGQLDTNFIGLPREPWAFSNNAVGAMGPPKWEQVKFLLEGSVVQVIQLNH